ncbi:alpha/beta fold hydrolase [Chthonobacter rhizosphaerae]|uniref:alpha/beta fold hydrolase n=1 Tax=Chthonobacter rhizosphaerae TaxID=2735553 RepID=UPI0015EE5809|nr:alpha/beta hydrolase [Chthonobacter rhizosphaerae]
MLTAVAAAVLAIVLALVGYTAFGQHQLDRTLASVGAYATIDGVRLHYLDTGPGQPEARPRPPVLVLHGASGNLNEPRTALGRHLAGRRVVYVDRPGHGHSDRPSRRLAAPAAQARLMAGLLDHLGIDRAIVVGHSWGGAVVAALGVLHKDKVAGLVFVAPATHPWPGGVTWYYSVAAHPVVGRLFAWTLAYPVGRLALERAATGVFAPEPVPDRYRDDAHVELVLRPRSFIANAEDVADLKANVTALSPRYPEITAPTVIVTGDQDAVVWPSVHSQGLKRDIAGAELVVLPGVGHMPHHTRPDAVMAAIDRVTARALATAEGSRKGSPAG